MVTVLNIKNYCPHMDLLIQKRRFDSNKIFCPICSKEIANSYRPSEEDINNDIDFFNILNKKISYKNLELWYPKIWISLFKYTNKYPDIDIKERIFIFKNKISDPIKCLCGNNCSFDWKKGHYRKSCEKCNRKKSTSYTQKELLKYWGNFVQKYFNILPSKVTLVKKNTLILENICPHMEKIEIKKLLLKKIKKQGIMCAECLSLDNNEIDNNVKSLKINWPKFKTQSEKSIKLYHPYIWKSILIEAKRRIPDISLFEEIKYIINNDIFERPKCDICKKEVEFNLFSYSYNVHCTDHQYTYKISSGEGELYEYINTLLPINNIIRNFRRGRKEIDLYIHSKKLGIEYNGLYWHSDKFRDKYDHFKKWREFKNLNINLINIWEDDWKYRNNIIKNLIKIKLGIIKNEINTDSCHIMNVENKNTEEFLFKYNLDGIKTADYNIGLYNKDELIALMGLSKIIDKEFEIKFFCSIYNISIDNLWNVLFSYFLNMYKPHKIILLSNIDISYDELYEKSGFNQKEIIDKCWIIKKDKKYEDDPIKISESDDKNKLKIWGIGSCKWIYTA